MLTKDQIKEIRELLDKSVNPLFFFDNDVDGLASFLLLQRYNNRGKGVAIKTSPELDASYIRKVNELNPDAVFILDKPLVSEDFIKEVQEKAIELIWIDHHPPEQQLDKNYFNPLLGKKSSSEPVSYWAFEIVKQKKSEDLWLSLIGCLADAFVPEYAKDYSKEFPDLFPENKLDSFGKATYQTELGKIVKILSFGLKDRTTNVLRMLKFLMKVKSPYDILKETGENKTIFRRYKQINQKFVKVIEKAKNLAIRNFGRRLLFFQYSGDLSLSADIANELIYMFPTRFIVVAYTRGTHANISVRNTDPDEDSREIIGKALKGIEATYGGHKNACGVKLPMEYFLKFKKNLIRMFNQHK